jgi:uncharacterized iron-regulated membrane protein
VITVSQQWWAGGIFAGIVLVGLVLNDFVPGFGFVLIGAGLVGIIVWVRRRYRKERPKPPWPQDPPSE